MPFYRVNGLMVHLNLGGKLRKNPPASCCARLSTGERCCAMSTLLCDWNLEGGGTCDAPLCEEHGVAVGPDQHLCPIHDKQRRETEPELF